MPKINLIIATFILINIPPIYGSSYVPEEEWLAYKQLYNKDYSTSDDDTRAEYNYWYNKQYVDYHNNGNLYTFKLKTNQFSDIIHFDSLFPEVKPLTFNYASAPPEVLPAPSSYIPEKDMGLKSTVADQGTKCNSGWAYAAVKSIELMQALQMADLNPLPLSAQNIIDCAGSAAACKNQLPQMAFEYLTQYGMGLHFEKDYMNAIKSNEPGMCLVKCGTVEPTTLAKYSIIKNNDDESLKAYVGAGFPVVVEVNPNSFEFMHYGQGVYQPSTYTGTLGSHYMVVIGYDTDTASGVDYWLLQNSFGPHWGENGYMKWMRSSTVRLSKNALFPSELS